MTTFSVNLDTQAAQAAFEKLETVDNQRPLMMEISAYLVQTTRERFPLETAPDGTPWLPLQESTLARKQTTSILRETTLLMQTLRESYGDDFAGVAAGGPGVPYAAIHQLGGTPEMPAGPRDIPARPFLGVSPDDVVEIVGIVGDFIDELLASN